MSARGLLAAITVVVVAVGGALFIQRGMADWLTTSGYVPDYTEEMVTEYCKQKIGSSPMDAITENVFLGDMCGTGEWSSISHRRISKILIACARCPKPKFASKSLEKDIEVQKLNIRPGQDANLLPALSSAVSFIESGVSQGKNVLVSSLDGRSRSAAIVAAYLMKSKNLSVREALEMLRNKRPIVEISDSVIRQLELYSKQVQQSKTPRVN
eukprot:TRINITY_DN10678_c0_g1_i1.p1 TRINITY_DN10678_c0_g1~~TRINITY_DN10678_c0_g1_i1.p1  ORF type:complete len:219 (-),score=27.08 TRINITY_DN10678_c0_g1_i1:157-792(-)